MTIVIGCGNAAVPMETMPIKFLESTGVTIENVGCDSADDPANYPTVAKWACEAIIASGYKKRGTLVCGTGIGTCMTANKFKGIRAAVCHENFSAERSIEQSQCNVLGMEERVVGHELAKKLPANGLRLNSGRDLPLPRSER